jgi:hypothetical protein
MQDDRISTVFQKVCAFQVVIGLRELGDKGPRLGKFPEIEEIIWLSTPFSLCYQFTALLSANWNT